MRVLVVEDERDLNRILTKTLSKAGYSVDGCLNGEEMADHLLGAEYDAILMDVMMPGKDGFTLVSELRAKGVDTPILFLTARDSVADRVAGLDLGADDYLVKPFDFDELLARIRAMTRKHVGSRSNLFTVGGPDGRHPAADGGAGRQRDRPAAQGVCHPGTSGAQQGCGGITGAAGGPDLEL